MIPFISNIQVYIEKIKKTNKKDGYKIRLINYLPVFIFSAIAVAKLSAFS